MEKLRELCQAARRVKRISDLLCIVGIVQFFVCFGGVLLEASLQARQDPAGSPNRAWLVGLGVSFAAVMLVTISVCFFCKLENRYAKEANKEAEVFLFKAVETFVHPKYIWRFESSVEGVYKLVLTSEWEKDHPEMTGEIIIAVIQYKMEEVYLETGRKFTIIC